jgi:hypothetical protein
MTFHCRLATVTVLAVALALLAASFLSPFVSDRFLCERALVEPEPEQPNLHIRGTLPARAGRQLSQLREHEVDRDARRIIAAYPEVESLVSTWSLLSDDGTRPDGYHMIVELRPDNSWPALLAEKGKMRSRTRAELIEAMKKSLAGQMPSMYWDFQPAGKIVNLDTKADHELDESERAIRARIRKEINRDSEMDKILKNLKAIRDRNDQKSRELIHY